MLFFFARFFMQRASRIAKELSQLQKDPPPGIACSSIEDSLEKLEASIIGVSGTPYAQGVFQLEVVVPERYPFEPPKIRFLTPIYHPNIDTEGRICLDVLKPPPSGAWKPSWNLATVLSSIQQLMSEANPDDGLIAEIVCFNPNDHLPCHASKSEEYKSNRAMFDRKARDHTLQHAMQEKTQAVVSAGVKRTHD
jgi:ubiquitin-conjugating enzyme E2 T